MKNKPDRHEPPDRISAAEDPISDAPAPDLPISVDPTAEAPDADDSCFVRIHDAVAEARGVVSAEIDMDRGRVTLQYDGSMLSESEAADVAGDLALPVLQRYETCTVRIEDRAGRACESCALALERRMSKTPGVERVSASFRGGVIKLTYDEALTSPAHLRERVRELGFHPAPPSTLRRTAPPPATGWAGVFAWFTPLHIEILLTLVALVTLVAGFIAERSGAAGWVANAAYLLSYLAGGFFGVQAGFASLRHRTIDIDLLMILAALGAALVGAPFEGALLLFLFSLSNTLQNLAMGRTRNAIRELMKLRPDDATVRRGDTTAVVPIDAITVGEVFVLRPGDRVPLDGVVATGEGSFDQSSVTGESMPVHRGVGEVIFAGTINKTGALDVRVTKTAGESTLARLIQMVEEAQSEKAETQRFIDTAEQYYAIGVIVMTALAVVIPLAFLDEGFSTAFYRAMTLMVAASPCALVISTPATILSAIGNGARRGVLFKGGAYVEQAATIQTIAFDKTGTLTVGQPRLTDFRVLASDQPEDRLLSLAAAVQSGSEHALAEATLAAAHNRKLTVPEAQSFAAVTGKGVKAVVDGETLRIGNLRFFDDLTLPDRAALETEIAALQDEGKTCVLMARVDADAGTATPLALLAFADVLRENAAEVVRALRKTGITHLVMLTGDNERAARHIAEQAGLDGYYADLLPEEKMALLKTLEAERGPVAMVGDGVNDAPALATASLGIAMGAAGTDVALETADVILMADDLSRLPYLIALSRATRRTLIVNLAFAIGIMVAMVGSILFTGLALPLAVIGHEGSTVLVSLNGLRLLGFRGGS